MALPKIQFPVYTITLPVSKKQVQFRPFLAKEEKLLLMAQRSNDLGHVVDVVEQIINNVMITDIDVGAMPAPDVEYFFLKLRAKSVGETVEVSIKDSESGKYHDVVFDLEKAEVSKDSNVGNTIEIGDGIGLIMKPPSLATMKKFSGMLSDAAQDAANDLELAIIKDTIETVYDGETVYDLKQETEDEIMEFLGQLTPGNLEAIRSYYSGLPKVTLTTSYDTPAGKKDITLEGLAAFFQLG